MPEMPDAGENHRDSMLIASGDRILIADRPTWLGVPLRGLAALAEQLLPNWPAKAEA